MTAVGLLIGASFGPGEGLTPGHQGMRTASGQRGKCFKSPIQSAPA
ncbi:hypothetical protein ABH598_004560 [Salmonella enterica]